jgi:diguanylate cyclase (GGDEF)-like protein
MSARLKAMVTSANYFALVCLSALTISWIVSVIVFQLGIPVAATDYVRLNLFVTGCIAIPTAIIATLNNYHTRTYQRKLEELAWTDELTGLLNRRFFMRAAEEERQRMNRTRKTAAVALIDLDFFKEVNDRYGHAAGDKVLRRISQVAYAELRGPFDKLGRWGGEEFVFLLSEVSDAQAMIVCDRLRARIESTVIDIGERKVNVTASFGVCQLTADGDIAAAIEAADRALYEAKRLGRNRVEIAGGLTTSPSSESETPPALTPHKRMIAAVDASADALRAASIAYRPRSKRQSRATGSR